MIPHLPALCALPALIAPALAADNWGTDLPAALKQAAAVQGYVLLDFTGSDWCGACVQLQKDVLHTPAFAQYAQQHKLVLVEVDLPRGPRISDELKATNQALAKKYKIQGYPTILLLTPEGYVIGGFIGYKQGTDVTATLNQILTTGAQIKTQLHAAAQLSGVERAKLLHAAYQSVSRQFRSNNPDLFQHIVELTPKDETGLLAEQERQARVRQQRRDVLTATSKPGPDHAARQVIIIDLLARGDWEPELVALLYTMRADHLYYRATSVGDIKLAYGFYLRALHETPELIPQMKSEYERFFADPQQLFEKKNRPMPPRPKPVY